nr:unnamed protein product [Callosobruchus chinensis]
MFPNIERAQNTDITFLWAPSYTNIRGNEEADRKVKPAENNTTAVNVELPIADIIAYISNKATKQ